MARADRLRRPGLFWRPSCGFSAQAPPGLICPAGTRRSRPSTAGPSNGPATGPSRRSCASWPKIWPSAVPSTCRKPSSTAALCRQKRGRQSRQNQAWKGHKDHGSRGPPWYSCGRLHRKRVAARSKAGGKDPRRAGGPVCAFRADRRQGLRQRRAGCEVGREVRHRADCAEPWQAQEDPGRKEVAALRA